MASTGVAEPVKLNVFISYSRNDEQFAQDLLAGLEWAGFEPYLNKHDIAPGGETRLGRLIEAADTRRVCDLARCRCVRALRLGSRANRNPEEAATSDRLPTRRAGRGSTAPEAAQ